MGQRIAEEMGMKVTKEGKAMGSDDMALLLDAFPGFYANIGCANEAKGIGHVANHNACFTIDEDALKLGTEFLMKSACFAGSSATIFSRSRYISFRPAAQS